MGGEDGFTGKQSKQTGEGHPSRRPIWDSRIRLHFGSRNRGQFDHPSRHKMSLYTAIRCPSEKGQGKRRIARELGVHRYTVMGVSRGGLKMWCPFEPTPLGQGGSLETRKPPSSFFPQVMSRCYLFTWPGTQSAALRGSASLSCSRWGVWTRCSYRARGTAWSSSQTRYSTSVPVRKTRLTNALI